jgi:integrase
MPDRRPARLPKYRHYKPKDLGVVRLDGRDVYLGKYGSPESRETYRRVVAEWLAGLGRPGPAPGPDDGGHGPSVSDVILAFWGHAEVHYRRADGTATGELDNLRLALRPLRRLYGSTPARDFGPKALKAIRQEMVDSGLCRRTVNQRVGRIVRVVRWAAEAELVPASIHHALKAVAPLRRGRSGAREGEPVRPVPDARVEAIRPHVGRQVWALVRLQRLTGMRSGEACIMRSGDLDRSGAVWAYTPGSHKTEHHGHGRTIYLGPRAQEVLRPWLRADPDAYLFQPREAEAERQAGRRARRATPMTPSQRARSRKARPRKAPGDRYDSHSYGHAIARACDRAFPHPMLSGVRRKSLTAGQRAELEEWRKAQRWHPHQLRHSSATSLRKEFGLEVARIVLGHTSPAVTELYAEADRAKAVAAMEQVG